MLENIEGSLSSLCPQHQGWNPTDLGRNDEMGRGRISQTNQNVDAVVTMLRSNFTLGFAKLREIIFFNNKRVLLLIYNRYKVSVNDNSL